MKSKKLMSLGRRKALSPTITWIEETRTVFAQRSDSELLTLPFAEWCKSLRIKTPKGLQPFTLFDWQSETAPLIVGEAVMEGRTIVLLSSRQTGKTSMFLALGAYMAQATGQHTSVFIHKTGKDSGLLARRLKRFLSGLKLRTDSLSLLEFFNNSMIHFRSSNPTRGAEGAEGAGRGLDSVDVVIVEESGHTANLAAVQGVIGPALTWGNPKISVLIGTAGSKLSRYYSLLAESAGGETQLEALLEGIRQGTEKPFQILNRDGTGPIGVISNWRCIPEFAAESNFLARVQQELNLSDAQIASEYEMVFSSSVDSAVFDFGLVMAAQSTDIKPYEEGERSRRYVGVDPAGQGKDYAVAVVLRKEGDTYEACEMYRRRTGTSEQHLAKISDLIRKVKPSRAVVEKNSMGQVWLENLAGLSLGCKIDGFSTSQPSKEVLIGRLQIALEKGELRIPKGVIVDELLAFRRDDRGKLGATGSAHDDTVMALALALNAASYNEFKDLQRFPMTNAEVGPMSESDVFDWMNT